MTSHVRRSFKREEKVIWQSKTFSCSLWCQRSHPNLRWKSSKNSWWPSPLSDISLHSGSRYQKRQPKRASNHLTIVIKLIVETLQTLARSLATRKHRVSLIKNFQKNLTSMLINRLLQRSLTNWPRQSRRRHSTHTKTSVTSKSNSRPILPQSPRNYPKQSLRSWIIKCDESRYRQSTVTPQLSKLSKHSQSLALSKNLRHQTLLSKKNSIKSSLNFYKRLIPTF